MWLPDPQPGFGILICGSWDNEQLQFITGYPRTDKAMCMNLHLVVLWNIQVSFRIPVYVESTPGLLWGEGGINPLSAVIV